MHSEHIQNVHLGWVVGGWLVALAVTSVAFMVGVGLGFIGPERGGAEFLVPVTVLVGFFAGGLFVGLRWADAPILHGAAITLLSVIAWFLGSVLFPGGAAGAGWGLDRPALLPGMILVQLVSAIVGGWVGRSLVLRGGVSGEVG